MTTGEHPAFEFEVCETIRCHALSFPETTEGASCVNRTFAVAGKNFLFLGERADRITLRLKSANGWEKIEFAPEAAPDVDQLTTSVTESFELLAPRRLQHTRPGD